MDVYVIVPKGYRPPDGHTSWQGAAEELAYLIDGETCEVININIVKDSSSIWAKLAFWRSRS